MSSALPSFLCAASISILLAAPAACGGRSTVEGSAGSTGGSTSTSSTGSSTLPALCQAADAHVSWSTCPGSVYLWAQGLGSTWQEVFDAQCTTHAGIAMCQAVVSAYYQCIATSTVTCMPCVAGPDVGECKGEDGIVWASDCSSAAFDMFSCTGK